MTTFDCPFEHKGYMLNDNNLNMFRFCVCLEYYDHLNT